MREASRYSYDSKGGIRKASGGCYVLCKFLRTLVYANARVQGVGLIRTQVPTVLPRCGGTDQGRPMQPPPLIIEHVGHVM